jgi:hypothetical protein
MAQCMRHAPLDIFTHSCLDMHGEYILTHTVTSNTDSNSNSDSKHDTNRDSIEERKSDFNLLSPLANLPQNIFSFLYSLEKESNEGSSTGDCQVQWHLSWKSISTCC